MGRLLFSMAGAALLVGSALGCSDPKSAGESAPPPGISCASSVAASSPDTARGALASATPGACVILKAASYAGPFTVPAGVSLVAENGARATLTGGTSQDPAITVGEGGQLVGVDVIDAPGVAIAVRGANARLEDVNVRGAKSAALAVLCKDGAACAAGNITLTDVSLTASSLGLWVSGAHVTMTGGASSSHAGSSLTAAAGIIAQDGAKLDLDGVVVEKNQGVGILVDGAATTASVKNGTVSENGERGFWAQRVVGTLTAPAVRIENTKVEKNRIVGIGAVESRGIVVTGGRIAETVAAPLVTNLAQTEQIGDGVGLFSSGDFRMENAAVESNARTAGLAEGSLSSIIIVGGTVVEGPTGLKFVVQNSTSTADIKIPEVARSTPESPLGISAPKLALPPVL